MRLCLWHRKHGGVLGAKICAHVYPNEPLHVVVHVRHSPWRGQIKKGQNIWSSPFGLSWRTTCLSQLSEQAVKSLCKWRTAQMWNQLCIKLFCSTCQSWLVQRLSKSCTGIVLIVLVRTRAKSSLQITSGKSICVGSRVQLLREVWSLVSYPMKA